MPKGLVTGKGKALKTNGGYVSAAEQQAAKMRKAGVNDTPVDRHSVTGGAQTAGAYGHTGTKVQ